MLINSSLSHSLKPTERPSIRTTVSFRNKQWQYLQNARKKKHLRPDGPWNEQDHYMIPYKGRNWIPQDWNRMLRKFIHNQSTCHHLLHHSLLDLTYIEIYAEEKHVSRIQHCTSTAPMPKWFLYNGGFHGGWDRRIIMIQTEQILTSTTCHLLFRYLNMGWKLDFNQRLERQEWLDTRSLTLPPSTQPTQKSMG